MGSSDWLDGRNGLRVVQLISPDTVPGAQGFSPRPNPKLIATYATKGEAITVSRGLERDRVVDETGGQTVVFGRRGSRPFHLNEMERFYLRSESVEAKESSAKTIKLEEGASVEELINGLQTMGATARDIVAILQAIKAAGGLQAELEIL